MPTQIQRTEVRPTVVQQTTVIDGRQTVTRTWYSGTLQVSSTVEIVKSTQTLPLSSALFRSFAESSALVVVTVLLFFLAYHRINAYRTRLHIYYEILRYTSSSSRLSSHIMRACNLETKKFENYIETLRQKGFVEEVRQDGGKLYRASPKGASIIRNMDLKRFIEELP
jgi:predicted transcriptional regulator